MSLENYLNGLPSNNKEKKSEYSQIKNELVYPMKQMTVQAEEQEEEVSYETIQERMKRLRNATGTVLDSTPIMTPAFPETPKPMIPTKPSFSSSSTSDAFEASLNPRSYAQRRQQQYQKQSEQQPEQQPVTTTTTTQRQPYVSPVQTKPTIPPPLKTHRQQQYVSPQSPVQKKPTTPPLPPFISTPVTPPPAVPNSPRPPKPNNNSRDSLVRTLNPIYAGLECPACNKPIEGSVVSAMEKIWHTQCFRCTTCHKTLENEQYYEKDNEPYCGKDYRKMYSLHCDFCHEPIENSAISALGKHYHEGHFGCTTCQKPFGDHSAFMVYEDKPYCQEDYLKICGKKCSGCGEYISGEYINALDQEWHKNCFNCFDCKRPFTNGTFLVKDNKPYCEEHYHNPMKKASPKPFKKPVTTLQENTRAPAPPTIKPKPPVISRKPDLSTNKPEPPQVKRPEINNYRSSSSNIKTEPTTVMKKKVTGTNTGSKVCHQCKEIIDGPCATALGHNFHIHHFQCSYCKRALSSRVPGMWQGDKHGELTCKMCAFKQTE
ncbi:hypothetical protein MFLAVUS_001988 [Mucor flavus]|uniref:LIM zinc-binding domain-containing protein n=1 Tax=Mucor flavus TaxID=439312 RepID=A0ABP9YP18_9FUNG